MQRMKQPSYKTKECGPNPHSFYLVQPALINLEPALITAWL